RRVLAGPGHHVRHDGGLGSVHRLLETSLLLGLEERVVVERILRLVAVEGHAALELRVLLLQLEVMLDCLREQRRRLNGHTFSSCLGAACGREFSPFRGGFLVRRYPCPRTAVSPDRWLRQQEWP